MASSMLSFILNNLPENWEKITQYESSYASFTLDKYSEEYQKLEEYFTGTPIKCIRRIQNPYQYGRFKLKQEMLITNIGEVSENH